MMKYLQRIGKSLMLPVAALPIAALLYGAGYWINSYSWGEGSVVAAFLLAAGGAILNNMALLFAIGVGVGMAKDRDGTSALAALISWLLITNLLSTDSVAALRGIDPAEVNAAFGKIGNQFIGILSGIIGAGCYNRFRDTKLPDALGFFSGKRCVAIVSAGVSVLVSIVLFFVWPAIYSGLVAFGTAILSLGGFGAAIYAFLNRLLIPLGLHHALNSVFWFDIAGINDLANFWNGTGVYGQTGMYMTGFFPIMMFGLPAGALAMYRCAKTNKRKLAAGLLLSAGVASFVTGVTEPLVLSFMFLAPGLYLIHAVLAGISAFVCYFIPLRIGFNFSGGLIDYILSFKATMAENPLLLIPVGLAFAVLYYFIFRFAIIRFNLKTPGREDDDTEDEKNFVIKDADWDAAAAVILDGLGGAENIVSVDNCVTRLRLEVRDQSAVSVKRIKESGARAVIRPSKTSVQVVIGTQVQFAADALQRILDEKKE